MNNIPNFDTKQQALDWIVEQADDPCTDNLRFAFQADSAEMDEYYDLKDGGCCGFLDREVTVRGMPAMVGCNYGH